MKVKSKKKLKVFHGLVNYGTQAGFFAEELRNQGFDAISLVFPDKFKRLSDIELKHGGTVVQKLYRHSWNWLIRISSMFKYDIYHFYYGKTLLPKQLDLYYYWLTGKKVVFHYLGGDVDTYPNCMDLDYMGRKINNLPKLKRLKHESKFAALQFVCAPWYSQFVKNSILIPLAIDLTKYKFTELPYKEELVIMHAPTNRTFKKSDIIEEAINRLINEGYKIQYKCITNVSHDQLKEEYISSDIVIDQLTFGYGTVSIEAMALGRPVVVGIDEKTHRDSGIWEELPVINANTETIYDVLKETIVNRELLPSIGYKSRKFIEKNHDVKTLTKRLILYYHTI